MRCSAIAVVAVLTSAACAVKQGPLPAAPPGHDMTASTPDSVPVLSPDPYVYYRLHSYGQAANPLSFQMPLGTTSCCDEIRAGWYTARGSYWVFVDTVAVLVRRTPREVSFAR